MQQRTVALEKRERKAYDHSDFLLEGHSRTSVKKKEGKADPDDFIELRKERSVFVESIREKE